jgi:hypothetical protein
MFKITLNLNSENEYCICNVRVLVRIKFLVETIYQYY